MRHFYLPAGIAVGRYELVRPIGAGSGGTVYEAVDASLGRRVALKVRQMPDADTLARGVEARFLREARAAAQIRHPNVVSVFDFGVDGDLAFLVMELVEGENLAQLLGREGALGPARTLEILLPILSAVAQLHAHGIVHRDIKPANILLTKSGAACPKLADFGLSRFIEEASSITESGVALGTPGYMAPEVRRSPREAGERSDQYALGIVLYECVTGARPFRGQASDDDEVQSAIGSEVAPPSALDASLPDGLDSIVLRAMHRDSRGRFASIDALAGALAPFAPDALAARWRNDLAPSSSSNAEPAGRKAATLIAYDGVAIALRGDAFIAVWNVPARMARVQWMFDAAERFQSQLPHGFLALMILLPSASPPDFPTMMECIKRLRRVEGALRRHSTVAVGGGIWQAMVLNVHRAVSLPLLSRSGPRTISGTIEDGIARVLEKKSAVTPSFLEIWGDVLALHEALDLAAPNLASTATASPTSR